MGRKRTATTRSDAARAEDELVRLLHGRARGPRFEKAVERLVVRHGPQVYTQLFFLAAHLNLGAKAAAEWWSTTREHAAKLSKCLKRPVDFRTALMDLMTVEKGAMRGPKIIELRIYEETAKASITDELTSLFNRRHFMRVLETEVKRATRYRNPLTLLLFDLDDFKKFNDRHGHLAGDMALRRFSRTLQGNLRDVDIISRFGGEEFAAILPQTDLHGARISAERIRRAAAARGGPRMQGTSLPPVTVSVGLAALGPKAEKPNTLIYSADMALYRSKASGKNTVSAAVT